MNYPAKPGLTKKEHAMDAQRGQSASVPDPNPDEMRDAMERRALIASQIQGPHKFGIISGSQK